MKRALEEVHPVGVQLEYFPISDDIENDDFGTAETLRMLLHDRIKVTAILLYKVTNKRITDSFFIID